MHLSTKHHLFCFSWCICSNLCHVAFLEFSLSIYWSSSLFPSSDKFYNLCYLECEFYQKCLVTPWSFLCLWSSILIHILTWSSCPKANKARAQSLESLSPSHWFLWTTVFVPWVELDLRDGCVCQYIIDKHPHRSLFIILHLAVTSFHQGLEDLHIGSCAPYKPTGCHSTQWDTAWLSRGTYVVQQDQPGAQVNVFSLSSNHRILGLGRSWKSCRVWSFILLMRKRKS